MATILVLDDDAMNLEVISAMLARAGHRTLRASGAGEAIGLCRSHPGSIELVVADVVLQGATGREVALQVRELRPDTAVLFVSGYPLVSLDESHLLSRGEIGRGRWGFLQKPFTARELLRAVQQMLPLRATAGAGF